MNTLSEYLKVNRITQAQFAAKVGVSQGSISRICRGTSGLSFRLAMKIDRATSGEVPVSSWADAPSAAPTPDTQRAAE